MSAWRARLVAALVLAAATVASVVAPRLARAEIIERVVAVVNDDAILLSDVRRRAVPFLPRALDAPTEAERIAHVEQLYHEVLRQLIDESLIEQAARKTHVHVTNEDVDRAIQNVQRQSGLEPTQFWRAVRQQGLTEPQYRADVRRQLLRLKVLNQRVRGRVNITEEDVRREYESQVRTARRSIRYHAAQIFFEVPASASATEVAAVRDRAARVRSGLDAAGFEHAAEEIGGGDLGWLTRGDLPEALENALAVLAPGEIERAGARPERVPHLPAARARERRRVGAIVRGGPDGHLPGPARVGDVTARADLPRRAPPSGRHHDADVTRLARPRAGPRAARARRPTW